MPFGVIFAIIPEKIRRFYHWTLFEWLPKTYDGTENLLIHANPFSRRNSASWFQQLESIYPHTLKYRLVRAICENDIQEIKLCLDVDPSLLNKETYYKFTPLSLASSLNRVGLIDYFILRGAEINAMDGQGRTPLIQAVLNWQIESIKTLVENGANINLKGKFGYSPLELAEKKGYEQLQKFLEKKREQNIQMSFPDIIIQFDFEKLIMDQSVSDLIFQKTIMKFQTIPHPFNDFKGKYKINYIKEEVIE